MQVGMSSPGCRRVCRESVRDLSENLSENLGAAEIGAERQRHVDAPVGALVGFEDADERARQRQAGAVQGVDEARLFLAVFESDSGAPGLEVPEIRAGTDLQPLVAAGRP